MMKRAYAVVLAVMLACGAMPCMALASPVETERSTALETQAAKKTVFVLTAVKSTWTTTGDHATGFPPSMQQKFKYRSDGLAKVKGWKYDAAGNLITSKNDANDEVYEMSWSKAGVLKKQVRTHTYGNGKEESVSAGMHSTRRSIR